MSEVILHAEKIDKSFVGTHAIDHVTLDFYKGEIHALIGENGSGKSTFTSCLTGIYHKDSGTFTLLGKEVNAKNQVDGNYQGVAIIVQEIGTLSGLSVAENIFLGKENEFTKFYVKNTKAMNTASTQTQPTKPTSSPTTANMKSDSG